MALPLTKLSETETKVTLGWTPVPGAIGYRFQSAGTAPKWSHTWDASKSQVTFSKAAWYKVEALGVKDAGEYPSVAPPPPPPPDPGPLPASKKFTRKSDFGYFFNGQGCSEISTPHGDGLRFLADTSMPAPWEANSKICQGAELDSRVAHPQAGDRTLWTWHMRFSAADNPNGFNTGWWGHNVLIEFGTTGGSVGHEFTINTDGTCSFFVREAAGQFPTRKYTTAQPVPLDAWIPVSWDIKWSYGSDGMMRGSIGGVQLLDRTGPTMWNGERVRHLGIGWYSVKQLRNAVEFAGLQYALL